MTEREKRIWEELDEQLPSEIKELSDPYMGVEFWRGLVLEILQAYPATRLWLLQGVAGLDAASSLARKWTRLLRFIHRESAKLFVLQVGCRSQRPNTRRAFMLCSAYCVT